VKPAPHTGTFGSAPDEFDSEGVLLNVGLGPGDGRLSALASVPWIAARQDAAGIV
jgi:hypothetical protein